MATESSIGVDGRTASTAPDAPTVFVSYRIADTADVVDGLAPGLRDDIGSRNVFRDRDSLIGGQPWQQTIDDSVRSADMTMFIVGTNWVGSGDDGRRIDVSDDPVRREVEIALASDTTTIPVLVDLDGPPPDLDDTIAPLFEAHAIRATRAGLANAGSEDYQAVLVSVWEAMRRRVPGGVLVLTDTDAQFHLGALVAELTASKLVDARKLSRLAAGVHVVPGRRLQRWAKRVPDVIVLAADAPSPTLQARIAAITRHPRLQRVAFLGAGVAAGLGIAAASSAGGGSVAFTAHTSARELGAMSASPLRGATSTAVRRLAGAGVATKAAVATCAVAAGTLGAVTVFDDSDITVGATVRYGYLDVTLDDVEVYEALSVDDRSEPAEDDEAADKLRTEVGLAADDLEADEQLVVVTVTIEETSEAIDWRVDTSEIFHLEVADALYHVIANERIELAASRTEQPAIGFVVPSHLDAGDARLIVQEYPLDADLRTRPAHLSFDGSATAGVEDIRLDNIENRVTGPGFCRANIAMSSVLVGDEAGYRDNGKPIWESDQSRLARPLAGRLFVTIVGEGTRDTESSNCSVASTKVFRPQLFDADGSYREAIAAQFSRFSGWSRQPTPWIWTFEVDESLDVFEFVISDFDNFQFSASLADG